MHERSYSGRFPHCCIVGFSPPNRPGFPCQEGIWMGSFFSRPRHHFTQTKNYQLLKNPGPALVCDHHHTWDVSRKQTVDWSRMVFIKPPRSSLCASVLLSPPPGPRLWLPALATPRLLLTSVCPYHPETWLSVHLSAVLGHMDVSQNILALLSLQALKNCLTQHFFSSPLPFTLFFARPSAPPPPTPPPPSLCLLSLLLSCPVLSPYSSLVCVTRAQGMGGLPRSSLLLPF